MKIDLLLVPMGASYAEMREAAIVAETAGFDGIWTWDHLRDPDGDPAGVPECWTVLTGLAEVTERVVPVHLGLRRGRPERDGAHHDARSHTVCCPRALNVG